MFTKHPGGYCCHPLSVGGDIGDIIEDVDEDEEECDKESHSARNNLKHSDSIQGVRLTFSICHSRSMFGQKGQLLPFSMFSLAG